jgi:hypothetical protein
VRRAFAGSVYAADSAEDRSDTAIFEETKKSAEQGLAWAQGSLGLFYIGGFGTPKNVQLGVQWLRKAGEQGDQNALKLLAAIQSPPPVQVGRRLSQTPPSPSAQPGSISWLMSREWRHTGSEVSDDTFNQDKARCVVTGNMAPVGAGAPEITFLATFLACFRAAGYEPIP